MPRFQAIFSDIDGTLLNPQHQLSPRNRAAGRAVEAAGIPIVLVSARPPAAMRPLAEALGPGLPLIALNGALILDGTDRIIQQRALSPAALATLATPLAEARRCCAMILRPAPVLRRPDPPPLPPGNGHHRPGAGTPARRPGAGAQGAAAGPGRPYQPLGRTARGGPADAERAAFQGGLSGNHRRRRRRGRGPALALGPAGLESGPGAGPGRRRQ